MSFNIRERVTPYCSTSKQYLYYSDYICVFCNSANRYSKLVQYDLNSLITKKLKNLTVVSNKYDEFDSSHCCHSDY